MMPVKNRDNIKPILAKFGVASALSLLVFLYSRLRMRRIKPSPRSSDYERISSKLSSQSLVSIGPSSSSANCDAFRSHTYSNFRNFHSRNFRNEDEFQSSTSSQVTTSLYRDSVRSKGNDKLHQFSYALQLKGDYIEKMNGSSTMELNSRQYLGNRSEESSKACETNEDPAENSTSLTLGRVKGFEIFSSTASKRVEHFESLKRKYDSMSQEIRSRSVTDFNKLHCPNSRFTTEHLLLQDRETIKDENVVISRTVVAKVSSKKRMKSYTRSILEDESNRNEKHCGVVHIGALTRARDLSDTISLNISPDDVIGVIGDDQFCKTRKAIINQQRVFTMQVFELHRLIKVKMKQVQRLMAGSADLFFKRRLPIKNPAVEISVVKDTPLEQAQEPNSTILKPKDYPPKPFLNNQCDKESTLGKYPLPFVNNNASSTELTMKNSTNGQYSRIASPASEAAYNKSGASWCFQPPTRNMLLVPVMSHSEGLAYKPISAPCPPMGGFMPPIYGSCVSGNINYPNAAYSVPLSYQQGTGNGAAPLLHTYFPAYTPPIINNSSHENLLSFAENNIALPRQSSCNISNWMREVMPCYVGNDRAPLMNELQGSTPSSPSDKIKGNVLPLFPTAPEDEEPAQNAQTCEHQSRAIKVTPRSLKSATESAARIFLSIQEERK